MTKKDETYKTGYEQYYCVCPTPLGEFEHVTCFPELAKLLNMCGFGVQQLGPPPPPLEEAE